MFSHKFQYKREREYYNENTRLAKRDRKLVENNYIINHLLFHSKVKYCSVDATAHYSFDWSQNVSVPHFAQQPSQMYFLTARKVHLFGVKNEATGEQINYVLDESELLDKGSNGTLSPVFDAIKQFNKGEKHLKLTCDNAVGQNKNNATIQFCKFLTSAGYYESVELSTMIAGHTKFGVDSNLGMIKKLYRKSTIFNREQFVEVVKNSSPAGLNKVQCYEDGQGLQYYDIRGKSEPHFTKLPKIGKYHHFHFSADNPNIVGIQEFADNPLIEINLWKDKSRVAESIEEIGNLNFLILRPKPLSRERQEYLYQNFQSLVPREHWNDFCPELKHKNYTEPKYLSAQECLDISKRFNLGSEVEEKVKANMEGRFAFSVRLNGGGYTFFAEVR